MARMGVYIITCLVNKKVYIGETKDLKRRKCKHFSLLKLGKHPILDLQDDYNKYGLENVTFNVIIKCKKKFLKSFENYWCNLTQAHNPKYGYNTAITTPNGGSIPSPSTRKKMSISRSKPIVLLTSKGEFLGKYDSVKHLAEYLNIDSGMITLVMSRKNKYYKEYVFVFAKDYNPENNYAVDTRKRGKPILMYSKEMNLIKEFISIGEAQRELNITEGGLWTALNIPNRTCRGFIWKYK